MRSFPNDIRLTDDLERKLMRQAIEEQFRFRPGRALMALINKLFARAAGSKSVSHQLAQSAR
jgi:hypothetical protein